MAGRARPGTWRPVARLREAVLLVQHLLARRAEAFEGEISLAGRMPAAVRAAPLPSADHDRDLGPPNRAIAAEVADEIKIGGSANPLHGRTHAAPGSVQSPVGVCLGAVTVVDRDRDAARALARREVAMYLAVVAPLDVTLTDPEWLAHIRRARPGERLRRRRQRDISDEMLDRFAFSGTPDDILRQVQAIRAAGATRVEFGTPHGLDPIDRHPAARRPSSALIER